jgi:hypothetical protein
MDRMGGGPESMMFGMGRAAPGLRPVHQGHPLRGRRGRGRGQGEPGGGRGLSAQSEKVHGHRRGHAEGRAARRPSGHRQDHAGQGRGRRGERAVLLHVRLGIRGDVRRRRRVQGARPVQAGQKKAPCIVFIDEIDAIGEKRGAQLGGNDEREQTLNQLLTEMDGFDDNSGVIILAATNRPESLDPALLRPGRFDRRVPVELPDLKGREEILKVHAKKDPPGRRRGLARHRPHGLRRLRRGACQHHQRGRPARRARRPGSRERRRTSRRASRVVIAGYRKKNAILSDKEKHIVAYHEVGHALVAALQSGTAPVQKITIIPRTSGALGYTMQVDQNDKAFFPARSWKTRSRRSRAAAPPRSLSSASSAPARPTTSSRRRSWPAP